MPLRAIAVAVCGSVPALFEYPVVAGVLVPSVCSYLMLISCGMEAEEEDVCLRAEAGLCCFLTSISLGFSYFLADSNLPKGNHGDAKDGNWGMT